MISKEFILGSLVNILVIYILAPVPPSPVNSLRTHDKPPPPRSFKPLTYPDFTASIVASIIIFLVNGSPIWTAGLSASDISVKVLEANVTP
ncbi:hypothetical protein ES703_92619 [subsurface metagenome]